MTRNAQNIQRIFMGPFRGLNKNANEEDVPDGYFVDGENLVCTKKPGCVLSRPGYNHWKVDSNGYGVVFSDPIAILPGSGLVDGVITPPAAIPITSNPATIIPLDEEPPLTPTDGPIAPIDTPEEVNEPSIDKEKEPKVNGSISLGASPSRGTVDDGTDLNINFFIATNLPQGVTIATYAWDYISGGAGFSTDTTGSSLTSVHTYSTSDFSAYDNSFYAKVIGT